MNTKQIYEHMSKIYFLPVKHGDAFIIECDRGNTQGLVVVDGGPRSCGFELKRKLNELGTPDLMVLTHYGVSSFLVGICI